MGSDVSIAVAPVRGSSTRVGFQTRLGEAATGALVRDEHDRKRRARSVRPSRATRRRLQRERAPRLSIHTDPPSAPGQAVSPVPSAERRRFVPRTAVSLVRGYDSAATTPARPATGVTQRTLGGGAAAPGTGRLRPPRRVN